MRRIGVVRRGRMGGGGRVGRSVRKRKDPVERRGRGGGGREGVLSVHCMEGERWIYIVLVFLSIHSFIHSFIYSSIHSLTNRYIV